MKTYERNRGSLNVIQILKNLHISFNIWFLKFKDNLLIDFGSDRWCLVYK